MVLAEKNTDDNCIRLRTSAGGRRSRAASPNGHISDDSNISDDSQHDSGMRVGHDYQAVVPEMISSEACPESMPERALLVWSPCPQVQDTKLDDYITLAKEKYGYNAEQALGMLFWHKYDVEKALSDLPNFTPFPDEWTMEDKVLFEQAFQFHGKSFSRIRQMLPDKSIASLVKYYYSWKKTRCRTSLMDRQARKLANQREDNSDVGSEAASENESDMEVDGKEPKEEGGNRVCSNCSTTVTSLSSTPKGPLCQPCYSHYRRTGNLRASGGSAMRKHESGSSRHNTLRGKRRPPRGMHLNYDDLLSIATGPPKQGESILRAMDSEVVSLKRQVQNNKQMIGQLKHKTSAGVDEFRPSEGSTRINARWTNDELLLAVQGVRKYGPDFKAIAELIGNKTEVHVRSFFVNYRRRYNLDAVLHEYEAEHGVSSSSPSSTTPNSGETEPSKDDSKMSGQDVTTTTSGASSSAPPEARSSSSPPSNPIQAPPPLLSKSAPLGGATSNSPSASNSRGTNSAQNFLRNAVSRSMLQQPPPLVRPTPTTASL